MFDGIFNAAQGGLNATPDVIVINLVLSFLLSLMIALVYKNTHKGLSYSQSFVMTLIISGVVITAVMMVIGNNIALAFGAFGAFSLIRFRTAIKDARDMAYIFLVLAVGMAVGSNNYIIAVATTIVALLIVYILAKVNFGSIRKFDYLLNFYIDTQLSEKEVYKEVFHKYLKSNNILNIKSMQQGRKLFLSFSVKFISEKDIKECITSLERIEGISEVQLITAKNDVEY